MSSSDEAQTPGPACAPGTLEEELDQIEREQSEVVDLETKERELDELNQRARALAGELRAARMKRRQRSAENALPVIHPREPCTAPWDDMSGDDRVRACARCKTRVYDLGGLDASDARRLLSEHEGRLPTHVVGRVDGTVSIDSCAEKRRRMSPIAMGLAAAGALGVLMSGVALGFMLGGQPSQRAERAVKTPVAIETMIDELVQQRTAEAIEKAKLDAAKATPPTPHPATPTPTNPDLQERNHDKRRRHRCKPRRLYDPWAAPLFFFWDSSDTPETRTAPFCED